MGRHAIDMTGWIMKDHGVNGSRVTVIKRIDDYIGSTGIHEPQWECLCECGNIFTATSNALRSGQTRSCGCLLKESVSERRFKDLTGQVFGRLTVLYRVDDYIDDSGNHRVMWHCICECGNEKDIRGTNLTSGVTKSCGCIAKEGTPRIDKSIREYDENENVIGKICSRCKRMLPIDNYFKDSYSVDNYSCICKYCQTRSFEGRYQTYRQSAKNRDLQFDLTQDDFSSITKKPCNYCGEYSDVYFNTPYSGIDRVDSAVGYIKNNVVPCCTMCNRMKLDYNINVWVDKMKKILNHLEDINE